MPIPTKAKSWETKTSVVTLLPEQTIRDAGALHATLLAGLKNDAARVQLVTAELVHIDTAALQLLCAFVLEARQRGVEVEWALPLSEALLAAARLIGANGVLALE